jgi:hypothetical protein
MRLSEQICLEFDQNSNLIHATPTQSNKKIKRYRNLDGMPIAVETAYPNIWCLERHGNKYSHVAIDLTRYPVPSADKFGRHSGLKCIPEFRVEAAICFKPSSLELARKILALLAG